MVREQIRHLQTYQMCFLRLPVSLRVDRIIVASNLGLAAS